MGLIPFDMEISKWTKDMIQGMNAFKPMGSPSAGENTYLRMVQGRKAFESLQVRASYQMAGKQFFNDAKKAPMIIGYS